MHNKKNRGTYCVNYFLVMGLHSGRGWAGQLLHLAALLAVAPFMKTRMYIVISFIEEVKRLKKSKQRGVGWQPQVVFERKMEVFKDEW